MTIVPHTPSFVHSFDLVICQNYVHFISHGQGHGRPRVVAVTVGVVTMSCRSSSMTVEPGTGCGVR